MDSLEEPGRQQKWQKPGKAVAFSLAGNSAWTLVFPKPRISGRIKLRAAISLAFSAHTLKIGLYFSAEPMRFRAVT